MKVENDDKSKPLADSGATLSVEMWPISRPRPYAKNARKWSRKAIETVANSIREFGWRQPIVCDKDDEIIIGHLRLAAAHHLVLQEVPVHVAGDLTPAQVKALRIADNRTHEEADWIEELLSAELLDLKSLDFDLGLTGFSSRELSELIDQPNAAEDEIPPLPIAPVSRTGDLWLLGNHRLLCSDCTDAVSVAGLLGEHKPALLVCDPPYGISLDSEWRDRAGLNGHGPAEPSYMKHRTEGHHETSISGDTRADWSEAFALVPSLHIAYVWHASVYTREVLDGLLRIGFLYPQQIIWVKAAPSSPERIIGISTNRVGTSGRRTPPGSARQARTRRFGTPNHPNSSWAARMRRSSITPHRSQSN